MEMKPQAPIKASGSRSKEKYSYSHYQGCHYPQVIYTTCHYGDNLLELLKGSRSLFPKRGFEILNNQWQFFFGFIPRIDNYSSVYGPKSSP